PAGHVRSGVNRVLARSAEEVARAGYRGLMEGRRCVVPGWQNRLVTMLPRFLPREVVMRAMEEVQMRRLRARP
ncbi:MAG TPA: short-chain dehydrogenase, partial [Xanthobacteraceae bacterium]